MARCNVMAQLLAAFSAGSLISHRPSTPVSSCRGQVCSLEIVPGLLAGPRLIFCRVLVGKHGWPRSEHSRKVDIFCNDWRACARGSSPRNRDYREKIGVQIAGKYLYTILRVR